MSTDQKKHDRTLATTAISEIQSNHQERKAAKAISVAHRQALSAARTSLRHARDAGVLLLKMKHQMPHGRWLPWLKKACPEIAERTAQRYMTIAKFWPLLKSGSPTDFTEALTNIRQQRAAQKPACAAVRRAASQTPYVQTAPLLIHVPGHTPTYADEHVTLFHADSRVLVPALPSGALIVTDPPYNLDVKYDGYDDALKDEDYAALLAATIRPPCVVITYPETLCALARILKMDPQKVIAWVYHANTPRQWRSIAWFGCTPDLTLDGQAYRNPDDRRVKALIDAGRQAQLYDWWEVEQVKNTSKENIDHPCVMPVEIMTRILKVTPSELVVDPFAGSGSTLVAAKQLGIAAVGVEQSERYCAIAAGRCREVTAPALEASEDTQVA